MRGDLLQARRGSGQASDGFDSAQLTHAPAVRDAVPPAQIGLFVERAVRVIFPVVSSDMSLRDNGPTCEMSESANRDWALAVRSVAKQLIKHRFSGVKPRRGSRIGPRACG